MQAFAILANLFAASGHEVILEDPSFDRIQQILKHTNFSFYPVPVDEKGIQTDRIPPDRKASFVIVTPSHHFPLGSVLPIQRRVKLIEYARKTGTYLVENDYDSEFRYAGAPISALHLLDPDYVIYVGTFSESLYPALRLGYIILPESLLAACRDILSVSGTGISVIKQIALEAFIQEGYLEHHITKMKKLYRKKREAVIAALQAAFNNRIIVSGDATGLYVVVEFHEIDFSEDVFEALQEYGVRVYPVEAHAIIKGNHRNKVILGYGNLNAEDIQIGIERLKTALFENTS
jgi:GntR family transcriptional regulator/MocR family aminotransferase